MTGFVVGKLFRAVMALLILVTLTFVVLRSAGDPADTFLPPNATQLEVDNFRAAWGLDQPIPVQLGAYLANIVRGDLGRSFQDGRPVTVVIGERVPATLTLLGLSFVVMIAVGIPLGVYAALNQGSWIDRAIMVISVIGYCLPNFFLGVLLILVFAVNLRWLPSTGNDSAAALIMPVITIGTTGSAIITRFVRAAVLDVLAKPHVRAARARGLRPVSVITGHVLPNAAIPTVTLIGFLLGGLVAGGVITETVFAWPGIGRLTVTAASNRDLAVVQGIVLLIGASMVIANLTVDLLYGWLDPRIRIGGRAR